MGVSNAVSSSNHNIVSKSQAYGVRVTRGLEFCMGDH